MMRRILPALLVGVVFLVVFAGCEKKDAPVATSFRNPLPQVILWAWERPEDLTFLDSEQFGVAFLSQTLVLEGNEVVFRPRRQPLKVSPATKLVAVTRIESTKTTGERVALSPAQTATLVSLILKTLDLKNVSAIQIDFDAAKSEREFYRELLIKVRESLPNHVPLSMTALASFCLGDRWLQDLPVDEAVPMVFRMGLDSQGIRSFLASGNDFREPLCRSSYGIALDEPVNMNLESARRVYVFNNRPWKPEDVSSFERRAGQ